LQAASLREAAFYFMPDSVRVARLFIRILKKDQPR